MDRPQMQRPGGSQRGLPYAKSSERAAHTHPKGRASKVAQASYEQMLAPTASGIVGLPSNPVYDRDHASEHTFPLDAAACDAMPLACNQCGVSSDFCVCNPLGWLLDWRRAELWVGVTSFVGPGNFLGSEARGQAGGAFGFQEGFNFGSRLPSLLGGQLGSQAGVRLTQTHLDGSPAGSDSRNQVFATLGLFRRVDFGLQGGVAVDYLHDDWVYQADLLQLRGEASFVMSPFHELGFRFSDSQQTEAVSAELAGQDEPLNIRLASLNTYRFFYRYRFGANGSGLAELQAGFSEDSNAIMGVDVKVPLQQQLGLDFNATYLMPSEDDLSQGSLGWQQESWSMGVALVWTPGRNFGTQRDYYRPLLDVAHNGSLVIKQLR